jgi:hypothetical protein
VSERLRVAHTDAASAARWAARRRGIVVLAVFAALGTGLAAAGRAGEGETRVLGVAAGAGGGAWLHFGVRRRGDGAPRRGSFIAQAVFSQRPCRVDFRRRRIRIGLEGGSTTAERLVCFPAGAPLVLVYADGGVRRHHCRFAAANAAELFQIALPPGARTGFLPANATPDFESLRRSIELACPDLKAFFR